MALYYSDIMQNKNTYKSQASKNPEHFICLTLRTAGINLLRNMTITVIYYLGGNTDMFLLLLLICIRHLRYVKTRYSNRHL